MHLRDQVLKLGSYNLAHNFQRWKGHAATINTAEGHSVWGVLWELDAEHLSTLDDQEGVHKRLYERISVNVLQGDKVIEAVSYKVMDHNLTEPEDRCAPSKVYKNVMVNGALENGLPGHYVDKLKNMRDNGYEGEVEVGLPLHVQD